MATRLVSFWYQALASAKGVKVSTPHPLRAKQRLYKARKEANDPILYCLSIIQPFPNELWIVKREKPDYSAFSQEGGNSE